MRKIREEKCSAPKLNKNFCVERLKDRGALAMRQDGVTCGTHFGGQSRREAYDILGVISEYILWQIISNNITRNCTFVGGG